MVALKFFNIFWKIGMFIFLNLKKFGLKEKIITKGDSNSPKFPCLRINYEEFKS
mgnify:CR=1 FL=1